MKLGKCLEDEKDFEIDTKKFLSSHTFFTGITGSAKTGGLLLMLQELRSEETRKKFGYIPVVIADEQDEFLDVPNTFSDFVVIEKDSKYGKLFNKEHAKKLGETVRKVGINGRSVILKLSDFKKDEMEIFLKEFMQGFRIKDRQYWSPCVFVIDEADLFAPRLGNSISREAIIDMAKRSRKEGVSMILSTQNAYSVHMDARSQCTNRIIGNTPETSHRKACAEMLGLTKEESKQLWGMKSGEFFVRGDFTDYQLEHVQFDKANVKPPQVGIKREQKDTDSQSVDALTVPTTKDISVIDALESKIRELQEKITELEKNQLTPEIIKKYKEDGYSHGFQACKDLQDEKSIGKLLKSKIGI